MTEKDIHEWFDCECHEYDHAIRFSAYFWDDGTKEFSADALFSNNRSWYQRIWIALKYVFHFGETMPTYGSWLLKTDDISRLENLLQRYKTK
jgi:hypothetical protein